MAAPIVITSYSIHYTKLYDGQLRDYEGINKITIPLPPMLIAPSTAGAGSEVSQFAIIVDTARKLKMSVITSYSIHYTKLYDPGVTNC